MGPCRCFTKYLPFIFVALSPNVFAVTEDTVRSVLDETQAILVDGPALLQDYSLMAKIEDFQKEIEELKVLKEQLEQREKEIDRLVAKANAKQLEGFIARLNETFVKETALRNLTESIKSAPKTKKTDSEVAFVDRNELQSKFNTMQMISDSDYEISEWVLRVTQKELEEYKQNLISSYETSLTLSSQGCPTATEVVQEVQAALTKFSQDGIGMIDHAQGGEIVHIMTSPTFAPPPTEDHLLGNVWWRKFIPEDWEQLLPSGWESWNVGLPAFVYHSLVRPGVYCHAPINRVDVLLIHVLLSFYICRI